MIARSWTFKSSSGQFSPTRTWLRQDLSDDQCSAGSSILYCMLEIIKAVNDRFL